MIRLLFKNEMSTLYWYGLLCLMWLVGWLVTPIVSIVTANSQPESRGANRWQMESQTQRTDNLRTMSCLDAYFWLNIPIYFHFEPTLYLSVNVSVPLLVYFHDSTSGCAVTSQQFQRELLWFIQRFSFSKRRHDPRMSKCCGDVR